MLEPPEIHSDGTATILRVEKSAGNAPRLTLDAARALAQREIDKYLATEEPEHILLLRLPPGVGKTTTLVTSIHKRTDRTLYMMPRRDFFVELAEASRENVNQLYEWMPVNSDTCLYHVGFHNFIRRGYNSTEYCKQLCGWEYMSNSCVYRGQSSQRERVIAAQHIHAVTGAGFPEHRQVVIDENPLTFFMHPMFIPAEHIVLPGYALTERVELFFETIRTLAKSEIEISGPELYSQLGDIDTLWRISLMLGEGTLTPVPFQQPVIMRESDVEALPYFFLPQFSYILRMELEAQRRGVDYIHRMVVGNGGLTLLLRRQPWEKLGSHVIVADATGDAAMYESLFERKVVEIAPRVERAGRITQIVGLNFGTGYMRKSDISFERAVALIEHAVRQRNHTRIGLITHLSVGEDLVAALQQRGIEPAVVSHFYGARGSNAFVECDAVFVLGTPLPPVVDIERIGAMLYANRIERFSRHTEDGKRVLNWSEMSESRPIVDYDGNAHYVRVHGFWQDPELANLMYQFREFEILQCAHRGRPTIRDVDVYVVSSVPVPGLEPDTVTTIRQFTGGAPGIDFLLWLKALRAIEGEHVVSPDVIMAATGIGRRGAIRIINALIATGEWREPQRGEIVRSSPGRPQKMAIRQRV